MRVKLPSNLRVVYEDVDGMLNTVMMLSALMLSFAVAISHNIGHDDILAGDARYVKYTKLREAHKRYGAEDVEAVEVRNIFRERRVDDRQRQRRRLIVVASAPLDILERSEEPR